MPSVQIQISNIGDSAVQVKHSPSGTTTTIGDKPQKFAVKQGSNITVKYQQTSPQLTVEIIDADGDDPLPATGPKVTLKVYEGAPAVIEAQTSMVLELREIEDAPVNQAKAATVRLSSHISYDGVKCGEIIIYPPA